MKKELAIGLVVFSIVSPWQAMAAASGIDTPSGVQELPLSVEGTTVLNLSTLTSPPSAVVSGNVGVGVSAPVVALDVAGAVRAGSSADVTKCGMGVANGEGSQRYNYTTHAMEYCNGTGWVTTGMSGTYYECPYTDTICTGGEWASQGCIGQLSVLPYCVNQVYNKGMWFVHYACTPMGSPHPSAPVVYKACYFWSAGKPPTVP